MLEAPTFKEKFFIWFVRPFATRKRDEVPEGITDEELIRRGELVQRRYTLLTYLTTALVTVAVGLLCKVSGFAPQAGPEDLRFVSNNIWLPSFLLAIGLCGLLGASPWAHLVGGRDVERDYRLAFEAKHKVNMRRILLLCGLFAAALGAGVLWISRDYVAFDRTALRWSQSGLVQSRPLADIAEVRFYRRKVRSDGKAHDNGDAVILFKDGTVLVPREDIDTSLGLWPADCAELAKAAGVAARLDLDVLSPGESSR